MTKTVWRSLLLGSLLLIPGARAADAQTLVQACGSDAVLYCAGVPRGGGRIVDCLKAHGPQLSPACHGAMATAGLLSPAAPPPPVARATAPPPPAPNAKAAVAEACRPDIGTYCAGTPKSEIGQCLKTHAAQLSPVCRTALTEARGGATPAVAAPAPPPGPAPVAGPQPTPPPASAKAAVGEACMTDIRAYCASVPQGSGLIGQCLKEHAKELSPGCRSAIAASRAAKPAGAAPAPPPPTPQ